MTTSDGCRTMTEWVAGRVDVGPETASALVRTARALTDSSQISARLSSGELSFERAAELALLATPEGEAALLEQSLG